RVKHWVEENSIKMYDKALSVLRIETTINNPHRFKAYRNSTRNGQPCRRWLRLRKGVIAIRRLVQIARAANESISYCFVWFGGSCLSFSSLLEEKSGGNAEAVTQPGQ